MKTHQLPTPEKREAQLRRQCRERDAFRLIEALAALRDHWRAEDVPRATVEALVEDWPTVTVTEADVEALRRWPQLPLTLPGLVYNITENIRQAWDYQLS